MIARILAAIAAVTSIAVALLVACLLLLGGAWLMLIAVSLLGPWPVIGLAAGAILLGIGIWLARRSDDPRVDVDTTTRSHEGIRH